MQVVNNLGKGGLENGLVNLIDRMDPDRFEHVVCTVRGLGPNAERLPKDRVQVHPLGNSDSQSRLQTPALLRAIRRFEPDVVHSRNWGAIEAVVAGRMARGCAVVHSEHGLEAGAGADEPKRRTYLRRVAFELADQVVSVSFQLRDLHARRTGFPARKIAVIHNGVDGKRFSRDVATRRRVREELEIGEGQFCIGCVANLLPVKDHVTLLESLTTLAEAGSDWRLLLIGEGSERARLEAFVDQRPGFKPRVSFLGSSSRVPELLCAMDVFVLPSVAEGINNSLLEAMASGLAVVATRVGGNPEVVVDGESGLLFELGDTRRLSSLLLRLQARPGLRDQLGQRAVRRVDEQFSIDSMVQAYEQLYSGVRSTAAVPVLSAG